MISSLVMSSKTSHFIPDGVVCIGLHKDSPEKHWDIFFKDLVNPTVWNTEKTHKIIGFDYETTTYNNVYLKTYLEDATIEWQRKKELFKSGRLKTNPTKPSKNKKVPIDFRNTMVTGLSLCMNSKRCYYLNFGHSPTDNLFPLVDIDQHRMNDLEYKKEIRSKQGRWIDENIIKRLPDNIEFTAHNASFEYSVTQAQGWNFIYEKMDRYNGGFLCTLLMSKLCNYNKGRGLKELVGLEFGHDQPEYLEGIRYNHLLPIWKNILKNEYNVKLTDRLHRILCEVIKNIVGVNCDFKRSIDNSIYNEIGLSGDEEIKKLKIKLKKESKRISEEYFDMSKNTLTEVLPYAAQDSYWALYLCKRLMHRLENTSVKSSVITNLWDYYRKIEKPLILCVPEMSFNGCTVDKIYINYLRDTCLKQERVYSKRFKQSILSDFKDRFPLMIQHKDWSDSEWMKGYMVQQGIKSWSYTDSKGGSRPRKTVYKFESKLDKVAKSFNEFIDWLKKVDVTNPINQKFIMFNILCYPVLDLTNPLKGTIKKPSLNKTIIPRYAHIGRAGSELTNLSKVKQVYGLYALPYLRLVHPETNKVHGSFNLSGADTGRFTASDPNLQQVKKRIKKGTIDELIPIRKVLTVENDNRILIACDFSQIELRVMSFVSNCVAMMECYIGKNGKYIDIHTKTCNEVFNPDEKDKKFFRGISKAINFLCQYGGSEFTLLQNLREQGIEDYSLEDCKKLIDKFYSTYSEVKDWSYRHAQECSDSNRSMTIFGRPRYINGFNEYDHKKVEAASRQANNHTIQGTAGDIMKITMARIYWSKELKELDLKILITVHDELIMSLPKNNVLKAIPLILSAFTNFNFPVPICASLGIGKNFGELEEIEPNDNGAFLEQDIINMVLKHCPNIETSGFKLLDSYDWGESWLD